jgi:hypothetical protein
MRHTESDAMSKAQGGTPPCSAGRTSVGAAETHQTRKTLHAYRGDRSAFRLGRISASAGARMLRIIHALPSTARRQRGSTSPSIKAACRNDLARAQAGFLRRIKPCHAASFGWGCVDCGKRCIDPSNALSGWNSHLPANLIFSTEDVLFHRFLSRKESS